MYHWKHIYDKGCVHRFSFHSTICDEVLTCRVHVDPPSMTVLLGSGYFQPFYQNHEFGNRTTHYQEIWDKEKTWKRGEWSIFYIENCFAPYNHWRLFATNASRAWAYRQSRVDTSFRLQNHNMSGFVLSRQNVENCMHILVRCFLPLMLLFSRLTASKAVYWTESRERENKCTCPQREHKNMGRLCWL